LYAQRKNHQLEGEVVEVLERAKSTIVGTIQVSNSFAFVIPDSRKVPYDIFVPISALNGAKDSQKVCAKITEWPQKAKNPIGEIIDVFGYAGEHNAEMHAILAEFELPYKFEQAVLDEAK